MVFNNLLFLRPKIFLICSRLSASSSKVSLNSSISVSFKIREPSFEVDRLVFALIGSPFLAGEGENEGSRFGDAGSPGVG